jgi:exopolysaccharide biosynthesis polyprenyl glycosylphosphotransferase
MRQLLVLRASLLLADGVAAIVVFAVASVIRFGPAWREAWQAVGEPWWLGAAAFGLLWMGAEWLLELDRPRARWGLRSEIVDIVRAVAMVAVSVFSLLFLVHLPEVSRQFLLILFVVQAGASIVERTVLRWALVALRRRGIGSRQVLVVGTGPLAQRLADALEIHRELGFRVIGHLGGPGVVTRPVLGAVTDLYATMHANVVDELVLCPDGEAEGILEPLISLGLEEGKVLRIPLEVSGAHSARGRVEMLDGQAILMVTNGPDRLLGLMVKRALDVLVAATALVVLSPGLLLIALAIRMEDGGTVLFRQTRVGLHGRTFTMLKFRSMVSDAEERLAGLAAMNEIQGQAFKLQDDPRVTRVGAFLRRTSLDELPQVLNVLRGQMSIVGPRPPLPCEVATYDLWHRRRLSMKPGITGLWQVSARLEAEFDRWVELDLSYIDRWSLWLDLKIMLRTLPAMLSGR